MLRLLGANLLQSPALERVSLLQASRLQRQLGLLDQADATRDMVGSLSPTYDEKRSSALSLQELRTSGAAAAAAAAAPTARPAKIASITDEALWVQFAALLLEEGQWTAAKEWMGEALPLLTARGERAAAASCEAVLAKLDFLLGDPRSAMRRQIEALKVDPSRSPSHIPTQAPPPDPSLGPHPKPLQIPPQIPPSDPPAPPLQASE